MSSESLGPHVAISAATFTGNHGAEAMLLATVRGLEARLPGAVFHVFSYRPAADAAVVRHPAVRVRSLTPPALLLRLVPLSVALALLRAVGLGRAARLLPEDVRALAGCRVQVDLAGVSFVEGREVFLPFNVLSLVPAWVLGVPVVKCAQALGPFGAPLNRWTAGAALRRCRAVFARGERSFRHLEALELGGVARRGSDVAFLLGEGDGATGPRPPVVGRVLEALGAQARAGARAVGVFPSSLLASRHGDAYVSSMAGVVTALLRRGDRVVLLPHASRGRAGAGPRNNDLHVIAGVMERLAPEERTGVLAVQEDVHAADMLPIVAALDGAVVSRFHAMVACLSRGVPPVVVGWSHKYLEVMEDFGLGDFVLDAAAADVPGVLERLDALGVRRAALAPGLGQALDAARASASEQLDLVAGVARP